VYDFADRSLGEFAKAIPYGVYDNAWYAKGTKISNTDDDTIPVTAHEWHDEWNYTVTA